MLFPHGSRFFLRRVVAGTCFFLWSFEGISGLRGGGKGEVSGEAGVTGVELDILHFLFLINDYKVDGDSMAIYELPFKFKIE